MNNPIAFSQFIEWVFYGIVGGSVVYAVSILAHLSKSIDELNSQVAVIIERVGWHEKSIVKLEERVFIMETSPKKGESGGS